ncbi:hypothetical protein ACLB1E_34770 [Escherichia coli]
MFVPNPKKLPYNDEKLHAKVICFCQHTKATQASFGYNPEKQKAALATCKIDMAVVNKWSTCDLPSKPDADVFPTDSMYSFQAIRPATGTEFS